MADKPGAEPLISTELLRRSAYGVWIVVGACLLGWIVFSLLWYLYGVLLPFIVAIIIVYVLRPVAALLERWGLPRFLAVLVSFLLALLALGLLVALLVPPVAQQISDLMNNFDTYWTSAVTTASSWFERIKALAGGSGTLSTILAQAPDRLTGMAGGLLSTVGTRAQAAVAALLSLLLAPVIAFYLLMDLPGASRLAQRFLPTDHQPEFLIVAREVDRVLSGYLTGQFKIMAILAVLTFLLFQVAAFFGVGNPYALALSLLAAVFNIAPYVGPWFCAFLAGIIGLFYSPMQGLVSMGVVLAAQQIEATFISPRLMSDAVSLHPALVLLALALGGALFGLMGLVLALPVAATLKVVFWHFYAKYVLKGERDQAGAPADEPA